MRILTVIVLVAAGLASMPAMAFDGTRNGNGNIGSGNGNGNNTGNGNGNNNGSSTSVVTRVPRQTPSAIAPGLAAAGIETCAGSASFGASAPVFGISFGTTTVDKGCNLRLYSRTLYSMGYRTAATQLLCNEPEVAAALALQGVRCANVAGYAVASAEVGERVVKRARKAQR